MRFVVGVIDCAAVWNAGLDMASAELKKDLRAMAVAGVGIFSPFGIPMEIGAVDDAEEILDDPDDLLECDEEDQLEQTGRGATRRPLRLSSRQRRESAIIAYIPPYPQPPRHTPPRRYACGSSGSRASPPTLRNPPRGRNPPPTPPSRTPPPQNYPPPRVSTDSWGVGRIRTGCSHPP